MNINDYIASGTLEAYALGVLSREEAAEVDVLLNQYPELREELFKIEAALEIYAATEQRTAPPEVLENVLKQIQSEREESNVKPLQPDREVSTSQAARSAFWYAIAASLLLSLGYNVYQSLRLRSVHEEIQRLATENGDLVDNNEDLQQAALTPEAQLVRLETSGTDDPCAYALVIWNRKSGNIVIDPATLAAVETNKQYQLWAIKTDQAPINAGVFDSGREQANGLPIKAEGLREITFAITVEPRGGSSTPTGNPIAVAAISL